MPARRRQATLVVARAAAGQGWRKSRWRTGTSALTTVRNRRWLRKIHHGV